MPTLPHQSSRARAIWLSCLASAFRTALACAIVACTTLYGPTALRRQVAFPAFSYVTVVLMVTNATLGDALRGCWHGLYATVLGVCPAILSLWAIGPARFTKTTTALAVALSAFVVVLPEHTHLLSKRIALGQVVIVYVLAFINGVNTEAVMHPIHVAASTALGVVACVLALLLPYPCLASSEVKENSKLFAENASGRLKLFVKAFCAEDNTSAQALISQAKSLAVSGTKHLQSIKCKQEGMQWERFPVKILKPNCLNPGERLPGLETPLRGMEMALSSSSLFPVRIMLDPELKNGIIGLEEHINQTLDQFKNCIPFNLATVPESNVDNVMNSLQSLQTIPPTQKDLPSFFFLFCLKLLQNNLSMTRSSSESRKQNECSFKGNWSNILMSVINRSRFMPAFRCSLSLGLAVLFGLIYSKENGYWSGLPVAISLASAREATFKVINVKFQGTVLGTVYGVLGCFVFKRFVKLRFIALLPWFIFTSHLQRSRLYGQAGAVSSVIGAVLILGRQNFGPPSDFAIARIVETFIGLSCSIIVDILLQPARASNLAKVQLSKSLDALHESIGAISLAGSSMEESQEKLRVHVNELRKFIAEAETEPNFWFLPFPSSCYLKLLGSLSQMGDFLLYGTHAVGFLQKESQKVADTIWDDAVYKVDGDLEHFKKMMCSTIKCLEVVTSIKSLKALEKEIQMNNISYDLELQKLPIPAMLRSSGSDETEIEKMTTSYLQNSSEVLEQINADEGEEEVKSKLVLGLGALAFCMTSLVRETREIEKGIRELMQWENPTCNVNLYEISCKVHAL
ncbi:hypothetical protein RJ639_034114 [Escallonia herrerae]|uniref:Integral membrane bound transporter domain-containing protein n=1 Tax=Escallonia herrerae TaxID=1293975 RepID=A0AA88X8F5_9ASTE|nr:hypothetical protein RJ639_034114 [Escallonia herrerae]